MIDNIKIFLWSLRKLNPKMYARGLSLDVGSGANPHPFADVLLEKYIDNRHRYKPLVADRPIVLGDATRMPFRAGVFDFSFAFHILEHLEDPASFLNELQRVSKAGYIETPNALYERIQPIPVHLLEIINENGALVIFKKRSELGDDFIAHRNLLKIDDRWKRFFYSHPGYFHSCLYWNGRINYSIINQNQTSDWFDEGRRDPVGDPLVRNRIGIVRRGARYVTRAMRRRTVDLDSILACPECRNGVARADQVYKCENRDCGLVYRATPIPDFNNPI